MCRIRLSLVCLIRLLEYTTHGIVSLIQALICYKMDVSSASALVRQPLCPLLGEDCLLLGYIARVIAEVIKLDLRSSTVALSTTHDAIKGALRLGTAVRGRKLR